MNSLYYRRFSFFSCGFFCFFRNSWPFQGAKPLIISLSHFFFWYLFSAFNFHPGRTALFQILIKLLGLLHLFILFFKRSLLIKFVRFCFFKSFNCFDLFNLSVLLVINSTLELIDNDFVGRVKLMRAITFGSDPLVFIGTSYIRAEFIYFFERKFLSNPNLVLLLTPFLII